MRAKIYSKKSWVEDTNPETLKKKLNMLLTDGDYDVRDYVEEYFEPYGFSCVWLLGESHLAVHTFPEHEKTYIEFSICVKEKYKFYKQNIKKYIS